MRFLRLFPILSYIMDKRPINFTLSGEMEKPIMEFDVVDYAYVEIVLKQSYLR